MSLPLSSPQKAFEASLHLESTPLQSRYRRQNILTAADFRSQWPKRREAEGTKRGSGNASKPSVFSGRRLVGGESFFPGARDFGFATELKPVTFNPSGELNQIVKLHRFGQE